MVKKILLAVLLIYSASFSFADDFGKFNISFVKEDSLPLPEPEKGYADTNYYLDRNSYDPLLMRKYPDSRINVIGGTIDIPGIDSTLDFARKFRQKDYSIYDLQSDVSLTVYTKNIPKVLFKVLFGIIEDSGDTNGGSYGDMNPVVEGESVSLPSEADIMAQDIPQDEKERLLIQLKNSKMMIEGRVNPFRVKEVIKMYLQIMKEEKANGIQPKLGTPHTWSPEFINYCKDKGEMIPLTFTKLLTALASGVTSRHFKTGKEEALISYILSRPDESVTMDELFRQSYRMNNGEVYLSILSIENILSDYWRHPQRDKLAVTRKLANICNFYQGKGDKYGAWYHFHGIMLYGYVRGGLRAFIVANIETAGSHVLNGANDQNGEQQEDYVNSTGGKIGAKLARAVKKGEYDTFTPDKNYCDPEVYLNLHEDFRDRIEIFKSREFSASLSDSRLWIKSLNSDMLKCKVEIIYSDSFSNGRLDSRNKVIREGLDFKKGKDRPIYINSFDPVKKARAFINCEGYPEQAVEDEDPWADSSYRSSVKISTAQLSGN